MLSVAPNSFFSPKYCLKPQMPSVAPNALARSHGQNMTYKPQMSNAGVIEEVAVVAQVNKG